MDKLLKSAEKLQELEKKETPQEPQAPEEPKQEAAPETPKEEPKETPQENPWASVFPDKKPEDLLSELNDTREKYQSLEAQLKETQEKNPYANEFVKKINDFYESGEGDKVPMFIKLNNMDIEQMSSFDKMKASLMLKNPKLTDAQADVYLRSNYKINESQYKIPEGLEEEELAAYKKQIAEDIEVQKARLEVEVSDAENFLKDYKVNFAPSPKKEDERAKLIAANVEKVKEVAPLIQRDFQLGNINLNGSEKEPMDYQLTVDSEFRNSIPELVEYYAKTQGDPTNTKAVSDFLSATYLVQNWQKMLQTAVNEALSRQTKKVAEEEENKGVRHEGDRKTATIQSGKIKFNPKPAFRT